MYEDVTDEAIIIADHCPSAAACFIGIVEALPREFGVSGAVARAITDVKEALDGDEGDLAAGSTFEGKVSLLTEIEHVVPPPSIATIRHQPVKGLVRTPDRAISRFPPA